MVERRDGDSKSGNAPFTPDALREGVRQGVLAALEAERDRWNLGTVLRLALAGALGVGAAIGSTVLFSGGTLSSEHGWHVAICAATWAGLLVEYFIIVILRIHGGTLSLAHAASLALVGFVLAAVMGLACPAPRYLEWWGRTAIGGHTALAGGPSASALCLGLCSAFVIALGASLLATTRSRERRGVLPAAFLLFLLLSPAVGLQSVGLGGKVFSAWTLGIAAGSGVGVFIGGMLSSALFRRRADVVP